MDNIGLDLPKRERQLCALRERTRREHGADLLRQRGRPVPDAALQPLSSPPLPRTLMI